jgi:hypothetical protein
MGRSESRPRNQVAHRLDSAVSRLPIVVGRWIGSGTVSSGPAAGLGLTGDALPFPVIVIPTRNVFRLSPAETPDEASTQRVQTMKVNLHMVALLASAISCPILQRRCTAMGRLGLA